MRQQVVYVDVLVFTNFVVNYLLVSMCGRLCGRRARSLRCSMAALLGAVGSLAVFLPRLSLWISFGCKLLLAAIMVAVAWPLYSPRQFCKECFFLWMVSTLFAGGMLLLSQLFSVPGWMVINGMIYLPISVGWLLAGTVACYLALSVFDRFLRISAVQVGKYRVTVCMDDRQVTLRGMVDSGNDLRGIYSGSPVMVCGFTSVNRLFQPHLEELQWGSTEELFAQLAKTGVRELQLLPYHTASGRGLMPVFRPDKIWLHTEDMELLVEDGLLGITRETLRGGVQVLLHPQMVSIVPKAVSGRKEET